MSREVLVYPNKILRKKCQEVKEITPEIKELASDMIKIMLENEGVGLAAPQLGEIKRMIAIHPIQNRSSEEKTKKQPQVLINPRIIKKTKEVEVAEEGCLSFPKKFLEIKRSKGVEVEALNENGEKIKIKAVGFPARIIQHEIDHLNGILIIDKTPFWKKLCPWLKR